MKSPNDIKKPRKKRAIETKPRMKRGPNKLGPAKRKNAEPEKLEPLISMSPLSQARAILGSRLTTKNGSYWLDGRPIGLHGIMAQVADNGIKLERDNKL